MSFQVYLHIFKKLFANTSDILEEFLEKETFNYCLTYHNRAILSKLLYFYRNKYSNIDKINNEIDNIIEDEIINDTFSKYFIKKTK